MDAAKINIQVNFQQIVEAIKQLTPKEKLKLNELLWNEDTPIPIEHQQLVMDRVKNANENPESMLDWDEVSGKLA
ncbi:Putative addiction module component [Mucilaginibacter mallensis]|uniref:Putative addiction module component n=1 Tax=Mucilaginibacter mallensis TaxID=652787 RepID=A0A1H2C101_MUCMA|nr:addiction module protein [Mucilaginibacter mallensis]SDT63994.1 Putative addiction module component [Mucilaginibacter mallensis]